MIEAYTFTEAQKHEAAFLIARTSKCLQHLTNNLFALRPEPGRSDCGRQLATHGQRLVELAAELAELTKVFAPVLVGADGEPIVLQPEPNGFVDDDYLNYQEAQMGSSPPPRRLPDNVLPFY